jgi:hypothetical protein
LRGLPQGADCGVGAALDQERLPKHLRREARFLPTRYYVGRKTLRFLDAARTQRRDGLAQRRVCPRRNS